MGLFFVLVLELQKPTAIPKMLENSIKKNAFESAGQVLPEARRYNIPCFI